MSKIPYYEEASFHFQLTNHLEGRIEEMSDASLLGQKIAALWKSKLKNLSSYEYPVTHPIGQETFSLYGEFPSGVFEFALDIDEATKIINQRQIKPVTFKPKDIIHAVDPGNINTDLSRITYNHKNPVMVVKSQVLTDHQFYCINGNHRINEAFKNGASDIDVYVFEELDIVPLFYDPLSEAIYFLENDYQYLVKGNPLPARLDLGVFAKK